MYEIRTALSYLIPRRGQLSISVVGLIAVLVIQAITWLILVFFSTTEGFESRWSQKIIGAVAGQEKLENFEKEANRKQLGDAQRALRAHV